MLAGRAPRRIGGEERGERGDDLLVPDVLAVELVEPRAVEGAAEIEVVEAGIAADEADLGEIGPRAAVRAARHADGDLVLAEPVAVELGLERGDEVGEVAFAF